MIEMAMVIGFPHIYMVTEQLRRIILERLPLRTLFPKAISTFTTRPITAFEILNINRREQILFTTKSHVFTYI